MYQYLAPGSDLVLSFFDFWRFSDFFRIFYISPRKSACRRQLRRVISRQPLGVEKKVSPFWKLDNEDYQHMLKSRKYGRYPLDPPSYPLSLSLISSSHRGNVFVSIFVHILHTYLPRFGRDLQRGGSKGFRPEEKIIMER